MNWNVAVDPNPSLSQYEDVYFSKISFDVSKTDHLYIIDTYPYSTWCGIAEFYDTSWDSPLSEQGYFPNQNWSKNKLRLNTAKTDSSDPDSTICAMKWYGVAAHEKGHGLALLHSNVSDSVMWVGSATRQNTPRPDDVTGIRAKY